MSSISKTNYNQALHAYKRFQASAKSAAGANIPTLKEMSPPGSTATQQAVANWQPAILRKSDNLQIVNQPQSASFAVLASDIARTQVHKLKQGEAASKRAAVEGIDKVELVAAISEAETALKLMTVLRDKVVNAYMDIIKMPL